MRKEQLYCDACRCEVHGLFPIKIYPGTTHQDSTPNEWELCLYCTRAVNRMAYDYIMAKRESSRF